jgi:hypothetical protein
VATLPPLYAHRLGREPGPDVKQVLVVVADALPLAQAKRR